MSDRGCRAVTSGLAHRVSGVTHERKITRRCVVVRIPTGRPSTATEERIDEKTDELVDRPVVDDRPVREERVDDRSGRMTLRERLSSRSRTDEDPTVVTTDRTDTEPSTVAEPTTVAPAGPRPRSSLFATLSLIVG